MPSIPEYLRQHRWLRIAARALAALVVLWLLLWLALPPLLKGPLQRAASEQLGRAVTVGAIDFKPWTLELALTDVAVAGAGDGAPPQLTIGRIYADGELQSLLRLAPVVDALTVENPALRVTHLGDGRYDVDDIIAKVTAPPPEPKPDTGPARLALYNLALTGGTVDFTDQAVGRTHEVRDLTLKVPFISTLSSQREIKVEPQLAFALNGSRFDSSAAGTPFAQTSRAEANIRWDGVDLAPYLGYLPASLPVKLQSATLGVDVKIAFEQTPRVAVKLTGTADAHKVKIADRQGADLLAYDKLHVALADVRPLEQVIHLGSVELTAPALTVTRDAAGQINLAQLAPPPPKTPPDAAAKPSPAWDVQVAHAAVRGGTVRWADAGTRPAAALQATDVTLDVRDVALPLDKPFGFEGGLKLQDGTLRFTGEATAQKAQVRASVQALALQLAAPYLAQALEPAVSGQLTGDLGVQWEAPTQKNATGVTLTAGPLALEQLAVQQGKTTLASLDKLAVDGVQVPLDSRTATLAKLALTKPQAAVERGADGRWMFERWMKKTADSTAPASHAPPWKLRVADFTLDGGAIAYADNAQPRPVALDIATLSIAAQNVASDGAKPQPVKLSARVTDPKAGKGREPGHVVYQGTLAPQPLAVEGRVNATRLPLHALDGYIASALSLQLLRADAGFRGQVAFAQNDKGTTLRLTGDAAVEDLKANSTAAYTPKTEAQVGEELLSWKSLNLRGIAVATAPGAAPRVEVAETALADFFARITVNEAGRINLADLAKTPAEAQAANAAAAQPAASAPHTPASAPASAPAVAPQADPLAPVVRFGPVSLVNGRVAFSDYFIKPNYSADLSELTGKLSAFSSEAPGGEPQLADLELRGKAEGTASLEVTGKLNPLAKPLALDITGKVRDLELPPLSPYTVKYAGHGIERGKLSMDVNYKVLPNGQLTASNRLVLNQLTFGEPVQGAPNSLPVKLAVALLADRNGVIDLDLPISGSLNDPQFRLAPVIFRIIGNIITKAITAPFSLLAGALGGGDGEMSHVAFAPGSAALTPEARQNLAKVVKALNDRPALKITVTGMASLPAEREGMQRERLAQLVLAEKRRASPDAAAVSADEYPALLKAAYRRADITKPRNLVGMAKDISVPEMEALLLAHLAATEAQAAELAQERGQAVRAYLLEQKLPAERLFVAAPKAGAQAEKWTPRAELSLGTQ
ncbi:MAG: DUF748 domain-containing protein [Acidovorax sp.]|uniref:DUF748 domain-containing protein n=1 Tax=Acidovorax sp. TaxID=1872122 RepID=UPI0039E550FB